MDAWVKNIASHRGRPRIFLDGVQAARTGFSPGDEFIVEVDGQRITLQKKDDGTRTLRPFDGRVRTVSSREKNGRITPVIDINSAEILKMFDGMDMLRIVVTKGAVHFLPLASEIKRVERLSRLRSKLREGRPLLTGSISHGGGVLAHAIHQGLKDAGIESSLALANEIRSDLLVQAIEHNDVWDEQTMALALPMQELMQDDWLMSKLPSLECLDLALPCSGASKAGAAKKGLAMMEEHEHVGHLVAPAIAIINRTQPTMIAMENVPEYASSASAHILRHMLRDMGYDTHEAIVSGRDFGCLENRVRWTLVATTRGMTFDFKDIAPVITVVRKVAEIIDQNIPLDDPRWRAVEYLKNKRERDETNGSGFKMQFVAPESTTLPVLRKGYHKGGSTDPRLQHPENPDLSRLLTAQEHALAKGVPIELIEGLSETMAHQLLGQGIVYEPFRAVGERIGECMLAFSAGIDAQNVEDVAVIRPRICG